MRFSALLLKWCGWTVDITVEDYEKSVICVAPHTSNLDFILGILAYDSIGRRASFLMKESWFFFPLGYLFRAMGGIPVPRVKGSNLTEALVGRFRKSRRLHLAVTPEGTRSANPRWRKGFLFIAADAGVPVELGVIDYAQKKIIIKDTYYPTGNIAKDLTYIKRYYSRWVNAARYPEKFVLPD